MISEGQIKQWCDEGMTRTWICEQIQKDLDEENEIQ